ncbi:MATE family efflux transporter [Haloplasma contractile]|uniref:Multidrug export protein MepA n=1 Tax=Haloplasma contractile SSD-17B TaxID=1033810 RepID=U2FJ28_9MOLU|nr:MATE family efflux transporter [Haloplasma contractile]ERJ11284.1 DNA damage-inducible protein [Haloplasma contractile SSD-17B]
MSRQNRDELGEKPVSKLLIKLAIPASLAMMINGLYNVVDTIFIGRGVGNLAIGGLTIAFPIQMLIMGFAQMVGIGAASLVSRSLGAKDIEKADRVTGNAYFAIFALSLLITTFGLLFIDPLLYTFGATDTIIPYARDYVRIVLMGSIFFSFAMMSNNLIRAEGNAKVAMVSMMIGAVLNIALDPIFIFVFDLGIQGAALATVVAQFISFLYVLRYMYSGKSALKIHPHHLIPDIKIIREIFAIGFSAFARSSTSSIFAIVVNNTLRVFGGDIAIVIFGIVNRVIAFLFMPIIGVVQAMQPIAGYNYGAKKFDRVKEVVKYAVLASTALALIGWLLGQTLPKYIIQAFTDDQYTINEGARVFRIVIALIPVLGVQFVGATLFQAIGKAAPALFLSLLRQFILLTPLILILPHLYNLELYGVWLAFPIADFLAVIIVYLLMKFQMNLITKKAERQNQIEMEQTNQVDMKDELVFK